VEKCAKLLKKKVVKIFSERLVCVLKKKVVKYSGQPPPPTPPPPKLISPYALDQKAYADWQLDYSKELQADDRRA
jgi:hypothetical protein